MGAVIMWAEASWEGMGEGGGITIFADELRLENNDEELTVFVTDQEILAELSEEEYILEVLLDD